MAPRVPREHMEQGNLTDAQLQYLDVLSRQFPNQAAVFTEIINLQAILNLPKGTEHFMSDLHGEYDAFLHILNNCSGVIREKVEQLFGNTLTEQEQKDLLTLLYYPKEKMDFMERDKPLSETWGKMTLRRLVRLARMLSSKYTRSKVRKAMPEEFRYVIDELMHATPDEDQNQYAYHARILDTIWETGSFRLFVGALSYLIKRLAVDHLHIVGDIYDRGPHADKIMDELMKHHSLDLEWGNHDVLWMGAAAGSEACIVNVIRNNVRYHNWEILENGYGISLRNFVMFADKFYNYRESKEPLVKAINVILFKLEGQAVLRHPEWNMDDRLLFDKIDPVAGTVRLPSGTYPLNTTDFPTFDPHDPYALSPEEREIVEEWRHDFRNSERLQQHMRFFFSHGSLYRVMNNNLMFHGGVPLDEQGHFRPVTLQGRTLSGRAYMDWVDHLARKAFTRRNQEDQDFFFYLWIHPDSPVTGRIIKTFERSLLDDETTWPEPQDPYYRLHRKRRSASGFFTNSAWIRPNRTLSMGTRRSRCPRGIRRSGLKDGKSASTAASARLTKIHGHRGIHADFQFPRSAHQGPLPLPGYRACIDEQRRYRFHHDAGRIGAEAHHDCRYGQRPPPAAADRRTGTASLRLPQRLGAGKAGKK